MKMLLARAGLISACFSSLLFLLSCVSRPVNVVFIEDEPAEINSPVKRHGQLSTEGNQILDSQGQPVSLAGVSLFWANAGWQADSYYNHNAVTYVAEQWNASIIRAAIGPEGPGGYIEDPEGRTKKAEAVIEAAIQNGMYVIVDWHSHHAEDFQPEAIEFFSHIALQYGHLPNVIYEIYNEPLRDTDWATVVKPYSETLIRAIRAIDPDNLIVVGTQSWSQDVDKAADDPLAGFTNIAYALHFYAGTHKQPLRDKAQYALDKGLPLFVTEWGTVNADGDGELDLEETERWLAFIRQHNLSHCNWSLHSKNEGASILKPGAHPEGGWEDADLTPTGLYVRNLLQTWNADHLALKP